jgi:hypothetical protein
MKITPVEPDHRIQLPADWVAELGLEHIAALKKTAEGLLVRPCRTATWDEIFADKLPMGQQLSALDLSDVSGDDLHF